MSATSQPPNANASAQTSSPSQGSASTPATTPPQVNPPATQLSSHTETPSPDFTNSIKPFTPDALANGFSTLIGALLGAMLAYVLQRRFQRSLENKSDLTAAHRLMFSLLQQINTIVLIQRDYVHSKLNDPGRFLSIPATPQFDTKKNTLELPELSFLLSDREGRAILYEFYIAQENYIEALNQWNLRSALHYERVQPVLSANGFQGSAVVTEAQLQAIMGHQLFGSIVNSTNGCIELLRRAFQKLVAVKVKARAHVVTRFKTNDFTDFDFPDTYGLTETTESKV